MSSASEGCAFDTQPSLDVSVCFRDSAALSSSSAPSSTEQIGFLAKKLKLPEPIVHLKGFGMGIDFTQKGNRQMSEMAEKEITELVNSHKGGTVVFDGDSYKSDSFTALIPRIIDRIDKDSVSDGSVAVMAICLDTSEERKRFEKQWRKVEQVKTVRWLLQPLSGITGGYSELGVTGLKLTGSSQVWCLGGGPVVEKEVEMTSEWVFYNILDVCRTNPMSGKPQRSALCSRSSMMRRKGIQEDHIRIIRPDVDDDRVPSMESES